jgi:nitrite reductase (NO-forming)
MKTSSQTFPPPASYRRSLVATACLALMLGLASTAFAEADEAAETPRGAVASDPEVKDLPVEHAIIVAPPNVPPLITRDHPARVIVNLEVREHEGRLADGVEYTFWTFGGHVPGNFIRVREGDEVEMHLNNDPSSKMPHNIDLHAVIGSGGGATSAFTAPGHSSQFSFKALHAGLYVYHCATAPVPMHIGNGMYGLILVQPKEGMAPVDHEYYVMQGEFYTTGRYGEEGLQSFDMNKALDERPPYVVFNGAVGSLVGDHALTAKVGDNVRIFFGNGGPNLISSFHIIGEIFDRVYPEAAIRHPVDDVQTTLVPPGGATMVEFKTKVPGTYVLVDHSVTRAFNKGALGMLKVSGPENRVIYSGKEIDAVYLGAQAEAGTDAQKHETELKQQIAAEIKSNPAIAGLTKEVQISKGKQVYMGLCFACHQPDGKGLTGVFPPLAGSDFLHADHDRAIRIVLKGLSGPVTVNGQTINSAMPPQEAVLTDAQIADVVTYILNAWGNEGDAISSDRVKAIRNETK